MQSFLPRGVLDEILNLIERVSEGFPSYSFKMVSTSGLSVIPLIRRFNVVCRLGNAEQDEFCALLHRFLG